MLREVATDPNQPVEYRSRFARKITRTQRRIESKEQETTTHSPRMATN